ncbi:MAG: lasso RiPP family leader peptide-containing protein [bacterium]
MPVTDPNLREHQENRPAPKAYAAPRLTEFGHVERLTQGGASAGADGGLMKAAGT